MKSSPFVQAVEALIIMVFICILASCQKDQLTDPSGAVSSLDKKGHHGSLTVDTFCVFATGLENPRGLEFGPDGFLYVAEGGVGGSDTTTGGECMQVPFPIGPYSGSPNGARISKINQEGVRTTFASGFPSSQTNPASGSFVSGVSDVAFVGGQLYALIAGAGCSHGVAGTSNGVVRVNADGSWSQIANLSQFYQTHPVANPEADDFEPDGTPYSMVAVRGDLYVVEPNHGEVDRVSTTNGSIQRVIDISATQGHVVPTSIAYHGNFYVGNLGTFPIVPGTQHVYKITPSGNIKTEVSGLTAILGIVFDQQKRMYVLETSTVPGLPTPGTGCVLRVNPSGSIDTVVTGLTFPTGMTIGPDGALYISNFGFGFAPNAGQIVRVWVSGIKRHELSEGKEGGDSKSGGHRDANEDHGGKGNHGK